MRCISGYAGIASLAVLFTGISGSAAATEWTIVVSDPDGAAARVGAPVEVEIDRQTAMAQYAMSGRVELLDLAHVSVKSASPAWAQWDMGMRKVSKASAELSIPLLRFLMPPGPAGERKFLVKASPEMPLPLMKVKPELRDACCIVTDGGAPVLNYRGGQVAAPQGVDSRYARGDYIHPLYGPAGEVLTDDFPKDHPHHRGIWWSWPVTRWKNEVRDIWAVEGVWSRSAPPLYSIDEPVLACVLSGSTWKWGDHEPIVSEKVVIEAFRETASGRFIDITVSLTGLEDGVAIGGRPHGGYGGFAYRAAPTKEQQIIRHIDPPEAKPRRSWLDYSGLFPGGKQVAGVAIFEHPTNPRYPSELQAYASINCVMPAFPGEREVAIPKGQTLTLKHRLWIHPGRADEKTLADVWWAYANPPKAKLTAVQQ